MTAFEAAAQMLERQAKCQEDLAAGLREMARLVREAGQFPAPGGDGSNVVPMGKPR